MGFWQFKFKDELWENFQQLEVGDTFTTTITKNEKNKLNNKIGDIVFWYRTGTKKDIINGIYFVTEFISNVREDEEYTNNYSVEMRILESHQDKPFILENNGFEHIVLKTKKGNYVQYIRYLFDEKDRGVELYSLLNKNNKELKKLEKLASDSLNEIERIKDDNINSGKMFNPFLDMNLIKLEVKHLSFITNLLNPRGTHLQGNKFFKNFIKSLSEYENQESNKYLEKLLSRNNNIRVESEKSVDNGRIDIYIESDEYIIAIEGKIESKDHANQLLKYDKFLQKQDKPYLLVYLTKDGEHPINKSPKNLQLMSFEEGIKDFIDYSLENNMPEKIKITLDEYQKSLTTYLNNLEPSWTYTLDILNEITSSKSNFKKYQKMRNIYYREPEKYKYTAIEDVAINFEKSKAYIEILFFKKLYEEIIIKIDMENMEYELEESTLLMNMDSNVSIMKNINDVYEKRKTRLSPIRDEDFMLGLVGFNIKIKEDTFENNICIMNTVLGLIITTGEEKMYKDLLPKYFVSVLNMEKVLEENLFYSNRIDKFLDRSFLDEQVKNVIESIGL